MQTIAKYFSKTISSGASDLHLAAGTFPFLRIDGVLNPIEKTLLKDGELKKAIYTLLDAEQKKKFEAEKELDFALEIAGERFRINLHLSIAGIGLSARFIPSKIPSPESLELEDTLKNITAFKNGLVIITGPTGSGKSTTIASLIEEININRSEHIITIEDPIEFLFTPKKSIIEQRALGSDTFSFAEALRRVLRQDPDIIFIGEMRDPETIASALTAAETGHLVFSTLHTPTAADAVERIVDVFPPEKQKQILIQLSSVLRMVVAQRLYPKKGGGRVAAREILTGNAAARNLIRENKIEQLKSVIQTGSKDGMISLENSIKQLTKDGVLESLEASK